MSPFGFHTTAEEVSEAFASNIKNRTFLITGTSANGLGASAALQLARHSPAQLILVSRNKSKVDPVIAKITSLNPNISVKFIPCELSDQDSVRKAAAQILDDTTINKLDVVINNAGVMAIKNYSTDKHGNELQFSSNHIGHFLLTNLLMPKILAAGHGARIINLTSQGHRLSPMRLTDPTFSNGTEYNPWSAYGQSKTANVLFTVELARRLTSRGVYAFSVHPGGILETGLANHLDFGTALDDLMATARRNSDVPFEINNTKNLTEGTSTTLAGALDPELEGHSGAYLDDCQVGEPFGYAVDAENARKLWALSEELVGQKFDL